MAVTFHTRLDDSPGPIGLVVPEAAMAQLGPGKRYPVVVTLGGYSYRNTVGWYKGRVPYSLQRGEPGGVRPEPR